MIKIDRTHFLKAIILIVTSRLFLSCEYVDYHIDSATILNNTEFVITEISFGGISLTDIEPDTVITVDISDNEDPNLLFSINNSTFEYDMFFLQNESFKSGEPIDITIESHLNNGTHYYSICLGE